MAQAPAQYNEEANEDEQALNLLMKKGIPTESALFRINYNQVRCKLLNIAATTAELCAIPKVIM